MEEVEKVAATGEAVTEEAKAVAVRVVARAVAG